MGTGPPPGPRELAGHTQSASQENTRGRAGTETLGRAHGPFRHRAHFRGHVTLTLDIARPSFTNTVPGHDTNYKIQTPFFFFFVVCLTGLEGRKSARLWLRKRLFYRSVPRGTRAAAEGAPRRRWHRGTEARWPAARGRSPGRCTPERSRWLTQQRSTPRGEDGGCAGRKGVTGADLRCATCCHTPTTESRVTDGGNPHAGWFQAGPSGTHVAPGFGQLPSASRVLGDRRRQRARNRPARLTRIDQQAL